MRRMLALLVVVVLVLGACSSGDDDDAAAGDTGSSAETAGGGGGGEDAATSGGGVAAVPVGMPLAGGRSIIATAVATVSVDDVEAAARSAVQVAVAAGGFMAGQEARLDEREVHVTLRVPSTQFSEVLAEVSDLGEVVEADVSTDDVTEQVVDLDSRIASARVSVERLRGLLDQAGDVAQLASVEGELARREGDLESLLGRLRVLRDQVDLSTVDVRFTEDPPSSNDDVPGFVDALGSGWSGFVSAGRVVLAGVGYALPFGLLALVVALAVGTVRRRSALPVRTDPEA